MLRCSVGESCLINKKAMIEHDNSVGNYCVFCTYAVTGGHDVIIGMCAVVTHDIGDGVIVYGNPARGIRRNLAHKVFRQLKLKSYA